MIIELTSLSPVSFMLAKVGDKVEIKVKKPNKNEFRGSIGTAVDVFLVFKGQTKIGMIPTNLNLSSISIQEFNRGKIKTLDPKKKSISIEL
jgi:hypothetical protein